MKKLIHGIKNNSGRNNLGKITVKGIGSGNKVKYIIIDYHRRTDMAIVLNVIKDSNRNTRVGTIMYLKDKMVSNILLAESVKKGDIINSNNSVGSTIEIEKLPTNTIISNIEMKPLQGSTVARTSLTKAKIVSKNLEYVKVKIKKRLINVPKECLVTIGEMSETVRKPKLTSGSIRRMNKRPKVKRKAKNSIDR